MFGLRILSFNYISFVSRIISHFSFQACLGVTKRLLLMWMRGKKATRLPAGHVLEIGRRLEKLAKEIPDCFTRKPRKLEFVDKWKATELRQVFML